MTFPKTGILDNFNRADANPLDGSWDNAWWGDGNAKLLSNQWASVGAGWSGARYNAATYGADCEAYITISTVGDFIIAGRVDANLASPSGYYLSYASGTGTLTIKKLTSGSGSALGADISVTFLDGDKCGLEIIGTTITAYRYTGGAWSSLGSRTDATYSGAGYLAVESLNTTVRLDDFGGGTIAASVALRIVKINDVAISSGGVYLPFGVYNTISPYTTTNTIAYMATVDRSMKLINFAHTAFVATTNDGSNYWTIGLYDQPGTLHASFTTAAMSANTWTLLTSAVAGTPTITTSSIYLLIYCTKTGSPGGLTLGGTSLIIEV